MAQLLNLHPHHLLHMPLQHQQHDLHCARKDSSPSSSTIWEMGKLKPSNHEMTAGYFLHNFSSFQVFTTWPNTCTTSFDIDGAPNSPQQPLLSWVLISSYKLLMVLHQSYLPPTLVCLLKTCQPQTLIVSISIPSCNLDTEWTEG